MLAFVPAPRGSSCHSLSPSLPPPSLPPSLPVTRQPFTAECQGDGDVTLPAGWRPLRPTRVPRQRKAPSDCAPPGLAGRGVCAPTLPAAAGTPCRDPGRRPSPPAAESGSGRLWAPTSSRILLARSPPASRPLDSRTRLDASLPSALGRWTVSHARKDTEGSPGTAGTRRPERGTRAIRELRPPAGGSPG